jgi:hypothetical protein
MVAPVLRINQYLDDNGDGTGNKNANGNYSGAVENFYYESRGYSTIHRMIVSIEDGQNMRAEYYAALNAPLTNGILVKIVDSDLTEIIDITDNIPIVSNAQWGALCYDVDIKTWGAGDEVLLARWTFSAAGIDPISLSPGQSLRVILNDDFTGLVRHGFKIQGQIKP